MKKYILMLSVFFAGHVMAQKLTVENIKVDAGDVNDLVVGIDAPEAVQAVQFSLVIPEGASVEMDGEDYIADPLLEGDGIMPKRNSQVQASKKDDGSILIVAFNTKGVFTDATGNFVTISIEGDAAADGKTLSCKLTDIKAGSLVDGTVVSAGEFADVPFQIGVGVVPTGINSLNAEDSENASFNLAGQKVGKNYKGIVVKNGKKAIVK
jgi:hypothetical protein